MMDEAQAQARERQNVAQLRATMISKFVRWAKLNQNNATAIPWLNLFGQNLTSMPQCHIYEPSLTVILQGRKHVTVGEEVFFYDEANFLLTSIDMPVMSCVVEASETAPYMSMGLKLDLAMVRQLILDYGLQAPKITPISRGMATGPVTVELLAALSRLLDLLEVPEDIPILADLIHKEIVCRILRSEQGGRLWQIAMTGSQSNRIYKVISWLKHNYMQPLRVEELASMAAMSVSSMHQYFREITSMSPLQYQKQLRLQAARRLMLDEDLDAGSAALRVGYESASQFSREYHRLFGQPPMRDIKQLRSSTQDGGAETVRTA